MHTFRAALALINGLSRARDCWASAVAERFFVTLEHELLSTADLVSHRGHHAAIAHCIDAWYNPVLRRSTLGYVSPFQYEQPLCYNAGAA